MLHVTAVLKVPVPETVAAHVAVAPGARVAGVQLAASAVMWGAFEEKTVIEKGGRLIAVDAVTFDRVEDWIATTLELSLVSVSADDVSVWTATLPVGAFEPARLIGREDVLLRLKTMMLFALPSVNAKLWT